MPICTAIPYTCSSNKQAEQPDVFNQWFSIYKKQLNKKQLAHINLLLKNGFQLTVYAHSRSIKQKLNGTSNIITIKYFGESFEGKLTLEF